MNVDLQISTDEDNDDNEDKSIIKEKMSNQQNHNIMTKIKPGSKAFNAIPCKEIKFNRKQAEYHNSSLVPNIDINIKERYSSNKKYKERVTTREILHKEYLPTTFEDISVVEDPSDKPYKESFIDYVKNLNIGVDNPGQSSYQSVDERIEMIRNKKILASVITKTSPRNKIDSEPKVSEDDYNEHMQIEHNSRYDIVNDDKNIIFEHQENKDSSIGMPVIMNTSDGRF
jgi:hypothetical protein